MTQEELGRTNYVAFGYNSINHTIKRIGGFPTLAKAESAAKIARFNHRGVALVTHPQTIWFYKEGRFIKLNSELNLEVLTLLGV
jgi:hypothetical protein